MMKKSQQKKQLNCCFNEYIKFMIYQTSLYLIEILSSLSFSESHFANDWAFFFNYSSSIIFKSMIKVNKSIRTSNNIFVSSVHICRMTDLNDCQWLNLLTTMLCSQSSTWLSSSWTRVFILIWTSILTSLNMKTFTSACRLHESRIYSITWIKHWHSLVKLWSNHENK